MRRGYMTIFAAVAVAAGVGLAVFEWNREEGVSLFWMAVAVLLVLLGLLELLGVRHDRDGRPR